MWPELTIVTTVTGGYEKYLMDWANSIIAQTVKPGRVVILSHGSDVDGRAEELATRRLVVMQIDAVWHHEEDRLNFGVARNCAVSYADTEWVMHLDCDDTLLPNAIEEFESYAPDADVICAGYRLSGDVSESMARRNRLYTSADGMQALELSSMASGVSPFRKSFWERAPYRTDMVGAWDTALWIRFAQFGARFRATKIPVFRYRQHHDSIFNQRRRVNGWTRAVTTAQLRACRRNYHGVAVIIPRDIKHDGERETVAQRVRAHYVAHHPTWNLLIGICPTPTWIKGAAINDALARSLADVLVIADADCIVDPIALQRSVDAVLVGAPWSMPHHTVYRANRGYTDRICRESADILPAMPSGNDVERRYEGALGGGIVVISRMMYDAIGGFPLAFHGWGSEDRTFGVIANTLLGPCVRGDADLLHLWHPPQATAESTNNLRLSQRIGYAAAKGKDALMMTLASLMHAGTPSVSPQQKQQMAINAPINRVAPSKVVIPDLTKRRRIP